MENAGIGAEVSDKIRSAIKAKLMEIGVYVDEELPDYVMVMVVNKRSKEQMDVELELFLREHTSLFTTWLHQVLQKLQEVTIANLKGVKRKLSEDSRRKKKAKSDSESKEIRKKIKTEAEDNNKQDLVTSEEKKDHLSTKNDDCNNGTLSKDVVEINTLKEKECTDLKSAEIEISEKINSSKTNKQHEEKNSVPTSIFQGQQNQEKNLNTTNKSQTTSSEADDLDDEDCINIRTDGELLDTTEEIPIGEVERNTEDKDLPSLSKSKKKSHKKRTSDNSPVRPKEKKKQVDSSIEKDFKKQNRTSLSPPENSKQTDNSKKSNIKKQKSSSSSPPTVVDKVIDARELLNRRKAAKKIAESDNRTRAKSIDRSESPVRKRKSDTREGKGYQEEKDKTKRSEHDIQRDTVSRRELRDESRSRKSEQGRDSYVTKRREGRDHRNDFEWDNKKESSTRKSSRDNSGDDWGPSRPSKLARLRDDRKSDREVNSVGNRRESEEPLKRGGVLSQVVARAPEPEDDLDTPMPSVVKVTPRPRRPPSQQPSSTLIMKAISEANRSLANVPPRPDSTQQARMKPVFTRTLRQLKRIPPEKIAVSITNPLARQSENRKSTETINENAESPKDDELGIKGSENTTTEVTTCESEQSIQNDNNIVEEWDNKEDQGDEGSEPTQNVQQSNALEIESVDTEFLEEQTGELSDTQFVVTLNGYDPDGLYAQNLGECMDDWLKKDEPVYTSTPNEGISPRQEQTSPILIMNTPGVNRSNLIEVELVKSKSAERCKYWPACRLAEKCTFYHPTKPCKIFPACKFGDACLYIHPQCKYNALCTRKDCVFSHTSAQTPLQPAVLSKFNALYATSAPIPCKFYPNCANTNCQFAHPQRACRYGLYCTKKDCSFDHGQLPPVDKLKWTRAPTT